MPSREQYVAQRVGARMQSRGEPMVLRRITKSTGAIPYRNPPDASDDLVVTSGVSDSFGQEYFGISGSSISGRLICGDRVLVWDPSRLTPVSTWLVGVMPAYVATDTDGIPEVDGSHVPVSGAATPYSPDSLAADNAFKAIPVSLLNGASAPAAAVGLSATLVYAADQPVFGSCMSAQAMVSMGWTEVDNLGIRLAAYASGVIMPPLVDDQILVNGQLRSILTVTSMFSNGIDLLYMLQAR